VIVVDASALLAIFEEEDDAAIYASAIAEADPPLLSTASMVEVGIAMLGRHGSKAVDRANRFVREAGLQLESVTAEHAQLAIGAYATYGKGRNGRAGLNFGDCFSYALAKATGAPLLFKGHDFSATDIPSVL
jgi:ribonuclease VapC